MIKLNSSIFAFSLFVLCLTLQGCGGGGSDNSSSQVNAPPAQDNSPPSQSTAARAYLEEVVSILRNNVVTRYEVDWDNLESEVNLLAENANSIADTYPAITRALELVNTNHSFLNSSSGQLITYPSNRQCTEELVLDIPDEPGIAYIRVDGFSGSSGEDGRAFANNILAEIRRQDSPLITAWVVDLRNNTGGNMWPMIAGLGPLFEGELLGHFVDADENVTSWGYTQGRSVLDGSPLVFVDEPYALINPLPKIAVLSSRRVGSSGEATLIAFKKQVNVRMFGSHTCGLSTANQAFGLSDGSVLFLTTGIMADREQFKYGDVVEVDEVTSPENTMSTAINWLLE